MDYQWQNEEGVKAFLDQLGYNDVLLFKVLVTAKMITWVTLKMARFLLTEKSVKGNKSETLKTARRDKRWCGLARDTSGARRAKLNKVREEIF